MPSNGILSATEDFFYVIEFRVDNACAEAVFLNAYVESYETMPYTILYKGNLEDYWARNSYVSLDSPTVRKAVLLRARRIAELAIPENEGFSLSVKQPKYLVVYTNEKLTTGSRLIIDIQLGEAVKNCSVILVD